jgi:hypothetical protein
MANPTRLVVDCSTGITEEIELTDAEVAQMQADAEAYAEAKAAEEVERVAKAQQKQAILERLGLTEDELKVVLNG